MSTPATPAAASEQSQQGQQPQQAPEQAKQKFRDETGAEWGFPAETPTAEMNDAERAEYYKHKARKHENAAKVLRNENEGLKRGGDKAEKAETAVDEAAVRADERSKWAARLLAAEIRAAAPGLAGVQQIAANLNPMNFLDADGELDADKVSDFVSAIKPKGDANNHQQAPSFDMGQGLLNGGGLKPSRAQQGADEARRRFGTPKQ